MNYKDTLTYLDSFVNYERIGPEKIEGEFNLGKMRSVLKELKEPHKAYKTVHVAGTKGKGSLSMFTASILLEEGYTVGLYTSPHLRDIRERIKVNGEDITKDEFASIANDLKEYVTKEDFTYFEVLTLIAIVHFKNKGADYAVFEVGLGGRLDATNVILPEVCAITPIGYDHVQILGDTIEEIASEKAGIIKEGVTCVSSAQDERAFGVIEKMCRDKSAPLVIIGKDTTFLLKESDTRGNSFDVRTPKGEYYSVKTSMLGVFQAANAAQAVTVCEEVLGERIQDDVVKKGCRKAFMPGRMEVLSIAPTVVIDGAQNTSSFKELKYSVEEIFKYDKLIVIVGLSRDKDPKSFTDELLPIADEVIITKSTSPRAQDPHIIRGYIKGRKAKVALDSKEAIGLALTKARANDLIVATGSFYLIAEVRDLLKSVKL